MLTTMILAATLAVPEVFADWSAGFEPETVGRRVVEQFLSAPPEAYAPKGSNADHGAGQFVPYAVVSLWVNAIDFALTTGDKALVKRLTDHFEPFFDEKARLVPVPNHVDFSVFGAVPYAVYRANGDLRCLDLGEYFATMQWAKPIKGSPPRFVHGGHNLPWKERMDLWNRGYTAETRFWIDDMYMITLLQSEGARATGKGEYVERAAKEAALYLEKLQKPNGLFEHGLKAPFYWCRGNGWVAGGMALILRNLPETSPHRAPILAGYHRMMEALLKYQKPDGLWAQLVDEPEVWSETSGSAMFASAFVTGVKSGWLDAATYGPAARRAYLGLLKHLDADANLGEVCMGTGTSDDHGFYLARPRKIGDAHGQAALMWTVNALLTARTCGMRTPETSRLFDRETDPVSGVVSCILRSGTLAESHQGWYFTTRSMTDDGRFLLFWTARNEFTHPGQEANRGPRGAACGTGLVDFATDAAIDLGIPRACHYLDVKTSQLWYIRRPDPRDPSRDAICRRDLAVDPMREIVECPIPPELIAGVTNIHCYSTHITLTQDRRKAFFTSWLDDRYVQGCVNFDTGRWERWGETDFYANHDQICPTDDNVALIAWENCWMTPDALAFRKRTGWYPRMWLCRPDGTHVLQPAYRKNTATHECWATDGKGFYWCGGGVWYQDLETGAQTQICPNPASHANLTTDNRFVCYDLGMEDRSVGHGNSLWFRVGFWNRTTQKGVLIHSDIPPMTPLGKSSVLHPHCHPAFGGADRYVIATRPCADGHFDLSVTPVAQLVEMTSAKGKAGVHD